jgi:hypothetical protein
MIWIPDHHQGEAIAQEYHRQAANERLLKLVSSAAPNPVRHAVATLLQHLGQQMERVAMRMDPSIRPGDHRVQGTLS